MTILQYLNKKYGERVVDGMLAFLLMQDIIRYNAFKQWITLTEYTDETIDCSAYKLNTITKLKTLYSTDIVTPEFAAIVSKFNTSIKKYNTCITYGTYDMFHIGHLKLLERIKSICSNLIVGISTDEFNLIKGKKCIIPYNNRSAIVAACKYVDKVIPENSWDQKINDIKMYNVNAFVMGNDWEGKFDNLKNYCEVIYLPRTEGISTTELKEKLKQGFEKS